MRQRSEITQTIIGAFCILIINGLVFGIGYLLAYNNYPNWLFIIGVWLAIGISIVQLIYGIPAMLWLRRRQQFALMKGVIIGTVITALLNGSCFLMVFINNR
jgi:Na+/proline symporter